jgi:hypothetical protein
MPKSGEVINEGFDLLSYLVKRKEPAVTGELPTVQQLEAKFHEIYPEGAVETAPKTDHAIIESEKEIQGLSRGSHGVAEGTACIPCSQDHLSTCSGLLAEALRFARNDGVESPEVISRIGLCRDELNAMERVDLRPELTSDLPEWEKNIANGVLTGSRDLRHDMAAISDAGDLEKVAGRAQSLRRDIGEQWLKGRIANMSPDEKAKVREKAQEILEKNWIVKRYRQNGSL